MKMKKEDNIKEKDLSMTRSIKYKRLQEDIDDIDNQKTKEISLKKPNKSKKNTTKKVLEPVSDEDGFFEDIMSKKEKKNYEISKADSITKADIKKLEKKASKNSKKKSSDDITEDDLFITQSFKPLRKRSKLLRLLKPILFFLIFGCALFGLVYFYVYPKLMQYFVTPRYVFESAIDKVSSSVKEKISGISDDVNGFDLSIDINSNKYTVFNDYNYSFSYINDDKDNLMAFNYYENEKNLGLNMYEINDSEYLNYSVNDEIYNVTNYENINTYYKYYQSINDKLNRITNKEDSLYLIDKHSEFMKSVLNKDNLFKENSSISINGVKKDVVKYSLNIDSTYYKEIKNAYLSFIKNDSRLLSIIAEINNKDSDSYITYYEKNILLKNNDNRFVFDIYMVNGTEFVGTDISINGFRSFYYYKYENNIEFYLNISDYLKGIVKDKFNNVVILVKGTKNDEKSNLLLNYNGRDKAELTVKSDNGNYLINYAIINSDRSGKLVISDDNKGIVFNKITFDDDVNIKIDYVSKAVDISNYEILESEKKYKNASNLFEKEFKKNNYIYKFDDFIKTFK